MIIPIAVTNKGEMFSRKLDVATCLLARDWKGFPTQEFNAVLIKSEVATSTRRKPNDR